MLARLNPQYTVSADATERHYFFTDGNAGTAPEVTGSETLRIGGYAVHYDGDEEHQWSLRREPFPLPNPTVRRVKAYAIVQALHIANEVAIPPTDNVVIHTTDKEIYEQLTSNKYQGQWPIKNQCRAIYRNIWSLAAKRRVWIMYDKGKKSN